ncbi:MAG TPA: ABC transporter ATP-binding protein [Mycobacteriales bacterium]
MSSPIGRRSKISSLWRLRTYVRPYLGHLLLMTAAAMLATGTQIAVPLLVRRVIDGPIHDGNRSAIIPLGLLALLFGVAEAALVFIRRWTTQGSSLGLETDVRRDLYRHLQRLPVSFHDRWQSGQLLSRATTDLSTVRRFIGFGLVFLVVNFATFIVVSVMLIVVYAPLGILVTLCALPLAWVSLRFERRYKKQARRVQDQQGEMATSVEESALGIRVIKSFGRRRLVFGKYDDQARDMRDFSMDKVHTLAVIWAVIEAHPQLVLTLVVLVGALAVAHGALTLGTLIAFVALFLLLLWPIESMGYLLATAQETVSATDRIFEVFDTPPTILDRPGATALTNAEGRVRFDGVGFTYPDSATPVLHDIDLTIEPGETVALVGATGTGKTSLTALVPRLYDVTAGAITIDGRDIRDLPVPNLRQIVATAFEDPTLFSASARENLTLGYPDATEEQVREALEVAQAEFVYDLPWGLDTRLGEQGLTLSGGQRQRLALARAIIGHPRVLVLDDPLSALDVHTEALVEEALRRVLSDSTALVVAHRASTVLLADRVALLQDGTITAVGTHHDLLQRVPAYRAILSQDSDLEVAT